MVDGEGETLIECPACGGDTRRECDLCAGLGCVSAAAAASWFFMKSRRIFTSGELAAIGFPRPAAPPGKPDPEGGKG